MSPELEWPTQKVVDIRSLAEEASLGAHHRMLPRRFALYLCLASLGISGGRNRTHAPLLCPPPIHAHFVSFSLGLSAL